MSTVAEEIKNVPDALPEADPTRLARKRRRKTQTNGAVEDCFACQKRQLTCDRRRPYCSQCLEIGKECSGYKTVLTWGVGVASRGKLRGMSLPVPIPGAKPQISEAARRRTSFNVPPKEQPTAAKTGAQGRGSRKRTTSIKSEVVEKPYHFQLPPPPPLTIPEETSQAMNQNSWQLPSFRDLGFQHNQTSSNQFSSSMPPPMQIPDFNSSRSNSLEESPLSSSANSLLSTTSLSSYSDASDSHFAANQLPSDVNFTDPYPNLYNNSAFPAVPVSPVGSSMDQFKYQDTLQSQNDYSNNIFAQQVNDTSHPSVYSTEDMLQMDVEGDWSSVLEPLNTQGVTENPDFHEIKADPEDDVVNLADNEQQFMSLSSSAHQVQGPIYAMPLYHIPPRMQYLLDYYDKVICPVLVAFDSPSNPYRMYMMQLATQNAGLQNAIAALVTNNMRMRTAKTAPRETHDLTPSTRGDLSPSLIDRPSPEEQHYRVQSIEHLNAQLANPIKARDDSVLATLLILCLFHICDSGVSKFKTQLAGVQKLLRMRGQVFHSEFVGWVEMFFAWLDVMTSAVNDREIQIHGDSLDLMNLSANLGALEQYSGVDGRLFKLIARLSRLNLLSQSRPVRDTSDMTPRASPQHKAADQPSPTMLNYEGIPQDDDANLPRTSPAPSEYAEYVDFALADPDSRSVFWQEWRDLRQRLKEWEGYCYYDPPGDLYLDVSSPQRDLHHISESFRYSALLYTERLAFPNLPSSSSNFQDLVAQALYHCTEIPGNSCVLKFMLWPMFIIGTECVDERHRELIRKRCVQIQEESGFYNNMNGLGVLERVWKEHDDGTQVKPGCRRQAFRWRNAMNCADGEYIVI